MHAAAEEAVFYPKVVRVLHDGAEETTDAVHEHNEIRDAMGEVEEHEPGTELFLLAVKQVQAANAHHMTEEESEVLPQFRAASDASLREQLGAGSSSSRGSIRRLRGSARTRPTPGRSSTSRPE